jgi:hypothetical protein
MLRAQDRHAALLLLLLLLLHSKAQCSLAAILC